MAARRSQDARFSKKFSLLSKCWGVFERIKKPKFQNLDVTIQDKSSENCLNSWLIVWQQKWGGIPSNLPTNDGRLNPTPRRAAAIGLSRSQPTAARGGSPLVTFSRSPCSCIALGPTQIYNGTFEPLQSSTQAKNSFDSGSSKTIVQSSENHFLHIVLFVAKKHFLATFQPCIHKT